MLFLKRITMIVYCLSRSKLLICSNQMVTSLLAMEHLQAVFHSPIAQYAPPSANHKGENPRVAPTQLQVEYHHCGIARQKEMDCLSRFGHRSHTRGLDQNMTEEQSRK